MNVSLKIESKFDNWNTLKLFFESFFQTLDYCESDWQKIILSCEEIFVNICMYAYKKKAGDIIIDILHDNGELTIVFSDYGVEFNPIEFENKSLNVRMKNKNIGGLGILLVKKNMDALKYERKDGKNVLTIIKKLGCD